MPLAAWQHYVTDDAGNALEGVVATVVKESDGSTPTLYTDRAGTTPAGTITSDGNGKIIFYVSGGAYKITLTYEAQDTILRYVAIGTAAESDLVLPVATYDVSAGDGTVTHGYDVRYIILTGTAAADVDVTVANGQMDGEIKEVVTDSSFANGGFDVSVIDADNSLDILATLAAGTVNAIKWNEAAGTWIRWGTWSRATTPGVLAGLDAISTPSHITASGSAEDSVLSRTGSTFAWVAQSGGLASVAAPLVIDIDDGTTLVAATHKLFAVSGSSIQRRLLRPRHSTTQSNSVTITVPDDFDDFADFLVADDQTGAVTIQRETSATINGGTSVVMIGPGASGSLAPEATNKYNFEGETTENVDLAGKTVTDAVFKDYGETVNALGSQSGAVAADYPDGQVVTVTLTGNATSFAITNPPASGTAGSLTVIIDHGAGPYTWSHPSGITWGSGAAPTLSDGASEISILTYFTIDGGTTWRGFFGGEDYS